MPNDNYTWRRNICPILDEVYKASARSSVLDAQDVPVSTRIPVQLFKMSMELLTTTVQPAFVTGDVEGKWEDMVLSQRPWSCVHIDSMDNEGNNRHGLRKLAGEFIRTKGSPLRN